ncbi:MAG: hypothetical protein WEE36_01035 [Acidimicrobiia bacterium]
MSSIRIGALFLAMAVVTAGCGDDDATGTTTTTSAGVVTTTTAGATTTTGAPGDTTTTTSAPAEVEDPIDLDDLSLYAEPPDTSYRMTLFFHFRAETASGVVEGTQLVDGGKFLDPVHFELTGRAEGEANTPQCFEFHNLPGFIDPYDTFLDEGGMLMGEASLLEAGIVVNDRTVNRYAITIDNVDPTDDAGSEVDTLTDAYIDIDAEGRFVVQLVLNGTGRSDLLTSQPTLIGDIQYSLNFSEFGTVETLQAPEGC